MKSGKKRRKRKRKREEDGVGGDGGKAGQNSGQSMSLELGSLGLVLGVSGVLLGAQLAASWLATASGLLRPADVSGQQLVHANLAKRVHASFTLAP